MTANGVQTMADISDTLAALSEAATQGEWYADCEQVWVSNGPQVCDTVGDTMCSDAAFIVALANAYRTGQLVPVPSVERVARLIAEELGDNYDDAPADKREWTKTHGQFRGVFRDVNQPFRCDYDAAATAVIAAMKEGRE